MCGLRLKNTDDEVDVCRAKVRGQQHVTQTAKVCGVFDVMQAESGTSLQTTKVRAFSEEDIAILQTMAGQVANAIENARLFKQTQDALEELKAIQHRYIRAGWEKYLKSDSP